MGYTLNKGGGGSGEGELIIKYKGAEIGSFSEINFTGNDVNVLDGGTEAIIQIPPSPYAPYFNGAGAVVSDITTIGRYVASPISEGNPYSIGSWAGGSSHPTTKNSSISYSCGYFSISNNSSTILKVDVLGADGTSIIASNSVAITGNINNTNDNITIKITDFTTDVDKYKAKMNTTIDLSGVMNDGGKFSVKIAHVNGAEGSYIKTQSNMFYDSDKISPSMNNLTFTENTPVLVKLSGISFYGLNSSFNVGITSIDNINNSSYPLPFIRLEGSSFGLPVLNLNGSNLSGWDTKYNNTGASYYKIDWKITSPNFFNKGELYIGGRWIDWVEGAEQESLKLKCMVSTYTDNTSRVFEDFRNENRRLKGDWTDGWDSSQSLLIYDGGNGLQVIGSKLVYPKEDFTTYSPSLGSQLDYSSAGGDRVWRSFFFLTGVNKSNGIFRLGGHNITESDISTENVKIEVSVDKVKWFNVCKDYEGGSLDSGGGCRINSDSYNLNTNNQIRFTLGTGVFTEAGSNWGVWYRITFKDNATGWGKEIDTFEIVDW